MLGISLLVVSVVRVANLDINNSWPVLLGGNAFLAFVSTVETLEWEMSAQVAVS
jgi:hypothetical protein